MDNHALYPLYFEPILKEKIWGGRKLADTFKKPCESGIPIGESWEISGVQDNISVVSNGALKGENLVNLLEKYGPELVGNKIWETYGTEFPILIKFLDANADLSVQVHPNDNLAKQRHNGRGKTEMWYIIDHSPGSELIIGLKEGCTKEQYQKCVEESSIVEVLNTLKVKKGDAYYLPAGRVHTIGKGNLIAEIQQTSDYTYRIYDFDRLDKDGKKRELHTDLALDAIDFTSVKEYRSVYQQKLDNSVYVAGGPYFETNLLALTQPYELDYSAHDRFHILICVEGSFELKYKQESSELAAGQTVLIPASLKQLTLIPIGTGKVLETFVP